jgi:hypothetical protein
MKINALGYRFRSQPSNQRKAFHLRAQQITGDGPKGIIE